MKYSLKLWASAYALMMCSLVQPVAFGGIVTTVENAGVQATSVSGVVTETFDSKGIGNDNSMTTAVGNLSTTGSFEIVSANLYGGAGGTGNYFALGAQSGSAAPVTLTFSGPESFFGMWWSAGDANNTLSIYSGATLLETYTTSSLLGPLSSSYNGNPTTNFLGQDSGEKFAYIDFSSNGGPAFTSVVFSNANTTGTGFELDNLSVLGSVPEPSSIVLCATSSSLMAMAWLGMRFRQRKRLGVSAS